MEKNSRELTENDETRLANQVLIDDFKKNKLEKEARRNWDKFYLRNEQRFFKDRHWGLAELRELCPHLDLQKNGLRFLEAGCGVGNALFPLLEHHPKWTAFACDFSPRAIQMLQTRAVDEHRQVQSAVVDLTEQSPPFEAIELCSLIFVLSSVHPEKQARVVQHLAQVLIAGGSMIIRDYGLFDDHSRLLSL